MNAELFAALIGALVSFAPAAKAVALAVALVPSLVSALVACWHAAVAVISAVAIIPGCQKFAPIADKLKATESKITDIENNQVLPLINRLSAIPLPKKAS